MSGTPGGQGQTKKPVEVATHYNSQFMDELDGRHRLAKLLRYRYRALTNDLGGTSNLSYQELSLCKRLVHLERVIERKEAILAEGGVIDETVYLSALHGLSILCGRIGLKRRQKPAITLNDYLANKGKSGPPEAQELPTAETKATA